MVAKLATPEQVQEFMETPMNHYKTPRREDELDLIQVVRDRMVRAGMGDRLAFAFDQNRFIAEARNKTTHVQQFLLNRYLVMQFMLAEGDTSTQRYALIYEVSADEWLGIFDSVILPAMMTFDLPRPL
jgi:hypothetical protein